MTPTTFDPDAPAGHDAGLFGLPLDADAAAVHVLSVPWEPTTSYRQGTAAGPAAIACATAQVDLHDIETGDPWRRGIYGLPPSEDLTRWNAEACSLARLVHDAGGVNPEQTNLVDAAARVDALSERVRTLVHGFTSTTLRAGKIPVIIGGDHSVPLGAMIAAAEQVPALGLLHVDAHADLRVAYEGFRYSHASILHNVLEEAPTVQKVVQVGIRDVSTREVMRIREDPRIHTAFDADVAWSLAHGETWKSLVDQMLAPLPDHVWITFDIDGLDPSLCPRTGTPVPGGLSWHQACVLVRALAQSGRTIVGFDLCEVAVEDPDADLDEHDAIIGARLLYKLIGHTLRTQR